VVAYVLENGFLIFSNRVEEGLRQIMRPGTTTLISVLVFPELTTVSRAPMRAARSRIPCKPKCPCLPTSTTTGSMPSRTRPFVNEVRPAQTAAEPLNLTGMVHRKRRNYLRAAPNQDFENLLRSPSKNAAFSDVMRR